MPKQPAQPFATLNGPDARQVVIPVLDQAIANALMISFGVVVLDVFANCSA